MPCATEAGGTSGSLHPLVKGLFDDPQLPADVLGLDPGFMLLDGPDDLFFCIPTALHIEFSSVQV